jgi:hypothetical protein
MKALNISGADGMIQKHMHRRFMISRPCLISAPVFYYSLLLHVCDFKFSLGAKGMGGGGCMGLFYCEYPKV